jgi:predicted secreted protein
MFVLRMWCVSAASFVVLFGLVPVACKSVLVPISQFADDVVITRSQFGQTFSMKKGQTLSIAPPADFSEWQVDYASEVLQTLTPPDRMRSPGRDGWRFKAIASGETDVALTAVMTVDPNSSAPPPAPPRFSVTIRVQ